MIPKIVHYCWFGKKEKPNNVLKCIESWKTILHDYEFIEWNESNFDISYNDYTLKAYENQKFAFVSDVARLKALYDYGGVYLDTDVIVYKSFNTILDNSCVLGFEEKNYVATSFMGCEKQLPLIKEFLDFYSESTFNSLTTNVIILNDILLSKGLIRNGEKQVLCDYINVYPQEYFSPYDYINCVMNSTDNTYCAHLFYVSWSKRRDKIKRIMKKMLSSTIGKDGIYKIRKMIKK